MGIRRDVIYNLAGTFVPIVVSIITIPIYLKMIGEERYGVLAIIWLLLGYFGIFDFGLGRSTAKYISALQTATAAERAKMFWTAFIVNICLGLFGGILILPVAYYLIPGILSTNNNIYTELQTALPWLFLAVPIMTLSGVMAGALQGCQRFLELNIINIIGSITFQLLPLAGVVIIGSSLSVIIPAVIIARLLTMILLFHRCWRYVVAGQAITFASCEAGKLLRFGGWVTVSSIISPMMVILDRFVIGAILGAKAVSHYTVPFQLAERSTAISGALTYAVFPRLASAAIRDNQSLIIDSFRALTAIMAVLVALGIVLIEPLLAWWIDRDFADHATLSGQIILLGFFFNNLATIPFIGLQAKGCPDIVAKCHIVEVIPYLGLLFWGITTYGLKGAALAFAARSLVDFVCLSVLFRLSRDALLLSLEPIFLLNLLLFVSLDVGNDSKIKTPLLAIILIFIAFRAWGKAPPQLRDLTKWPSVRKKCT